MRALCRPQDLFPGLEVPSNDYGEFSVALEEQLDKHGLQKVKHVDSSLHASRKQ